MHCLARRHNNQQGQQQPLAVTKVSVAGKGSTVTTGDVSTDVKINVMM